MSFFWKSFFWMSFFWMSFHYSMSFCWMSFCWMPFCWMSFRWMSFCWMSFYWMPFFRMTFCWMPFSWICAQIYLPLIAFFNLNLLLKLELTEAENWTKISPNQLKHWGTPEGSTYQRYKQGILKREVSLHGWPPVWLVWNQLYDNWQFLFLFVKQTNPN